MNSVTLRRWHSYLGLLLAPSVLFFALTGALQVVGLHESHGDYRPPLLLEKLSSVHTDQLFQEPHDHHHGEDADSAKGPTDPDAQEGDEEPVKGRTLALKWFFAAVGVGLSISTLVGVWIGLTQMHSRATAWLLLGVGALIPIALLLA
jgi:hypothetical protein